MTVTHFQRIVVTVTIAMLGASCRTDETSPVTTSPPGVASPPASTDAVSSLPDPDPTSEMRVVASLGYPRDLLDRGRVNLKIDRADGAAFVIVAKQLVADHFSTPPVEQRRSVIPPHGQVVALQTLLGDVVDCADPAPVTADLRLTYLVGDEADPRTAAVPLTDATTLDRVRAQACTGRRIVESNRIELRPVTLDGETARVDLVVTRESGRERLAFDAIKGTVLFGVSTPFETGAPERTLEPGEPELTIPLTFVVNRCDPHAVAETTRKFGLDLYVSVDGAEAQRIDGPIGSIEAELETMLERCKVRTGQ